MIKKRLFNTFNWIILCGSTLTVCMFLGVILWDIFSKGFSSVSWDFVTLFPTDGMTKGGILPAIVGTVILTFITTLFSVPFGVACAIYLNEYARPSVLTNIIRASIRNLAGIPSIIYGLFGLALFVQALHLGTSVLSAGLTLGLLSLPYIITTTEEALKRIPNSLREATLALGVTQVETIKDVVLPKALPGILTGVILTLSRAAGETAPILFTGVAFYINGVSASLNQEFMALPYHLYMLSTQHNAIEQVRPLAYGTATVLILLVFSLNIVAFYVRFKNRTQD
ncbi:MAG TPA: phosphate ABC transporter permease PstA [Bacteroidia bacterium]|nr:phosphate ABC transporter permease PstA [Bacteroidia bacterium]